MTISYLWATGLDFVPKQHGVWKQSPMDKYGLTAYVVPRRPGLVPVGHKQAPGRPDIAFEMPELDPGSPEVAP